MRHKNETGQKYRNEGMLNERKWKKGDSEKKSMSYFCDISCENGLIKILRSYCNIGLIKIRREIHYCIVTMADEVKQSADTTLACFRGYADRVEGAVEKGGIIGSGVYEPGKVKNTTVMERAYQMGKTYKRKMVV